MTSPSIPASQPAMPSTSTLEKPQKAHASSADKEKWVVEGKRVQAEQAAIALTVDDVAELHSEGLRLKTELIKTRHRLADAELKALEKRIDDIKLTIERGHYLKTAG